MREILTLQIGSLANFVGSHFWNFQDEILGLAIESTSDPVFHNLHDYLDMNVLYRSGETPQGILTYTPRLLSIDHRGSLGSISSRGSLYQSSSSETPKTITWSGDVSVSETPPRRRNLFLQRLHEDETKTQTPDLQRDGEPSDKDVVEDLEETVEFWTDYSKVHFHPQSLLELNQLSMDFEGERIDEIAEKLRFFAEECDHLQGFQFVIGDSGEFTSLAVNLMEHVCDEYAKSPLFLYNVMDYSNDYRSNPKRMNDAVSFARFSSLCSLITPVGLPSLSRSSAAKHLKIDDEKTYHCSSVYAAALHSVTLPFRLNPTGPTGTHLCSTGGSDMRFFGEMLTGQGRRCTVTILDLALPPPSLKVKKLDGSFLNCLHSLTPDVSKSEDSQAIESIAAHGLPKEGGGYASVSDVMGTVRNAYESADTKPKMWDASVSRCPLPIPLPYPRIFSEEIESTAVATRVRSCKAVLPFVEQRLKDFVKLKKWDYGSDESGELEEMLYKMVANLNDREEFLSDSD